MHENIIDNFEDLDDLESRKALWFRVHEYLREERAAEVTDFMLGVVGSATLSRSIAFNPAFDYDPQGQVIAAEMAACLAIRSAIIFFELEHPESDYIGYLKKNSK